MKLLRHTLVLLSGAFAIILLLAGGGFAWMAATIAGRLLGIVFVIIAIALSAGAGLLTAPTRRRKRPYQHLLYASTIGGLCTVAALARLTRSEQIRDSRGALTSIWEGGKQPLHSRVFSILPEIDLVRLVSKVPSTVYSGLSQEKADLVQAAVEHTYFQMQSDPSFLQLPSAASYSIHQSLGGKGTGHSFTYFPASEVSGGESPSPILLMLHDSPANLKIALWPWKAWAEREGFIFVAPTCGSGTWTEVEADSAVRFALQEVARFPLAKLEDITLVATGTASLAVPSVLDLLRSDVTQIVLISPAELSQKLISSVAGERLLVLHGSSEDLRLPFAEVQQAIEPILSEGDVTITTFPNEDRFLPFTRGEAVASEAADWLARRPSN